MFDLLKQIGKQEIEIIDKELGFKLCRMDSVDKIVLGSFIKAGEQFATDVKVLDVESKTILNSASSKGEGVGSILQRQIDELSREISRGIGLSERKIKDTQRRIADVTTSSMDAYKYFIKGIEALRRYYFDDARRFLEKAVEIDTTFAVAYLYLGHAFNQLENNKARDEAYARAITFKSKVNYKEKLNIEFIESNAEERLRILKQRAKQYPKEKRAHYSLGYYYRMQNSYEQAIKELTRAIELDPNLGEALNQLGYTYMDIGNFKKAEEYFKRYLSIAPEDANPHDSMAELYFKLGRLDEAIARFKDALAIKPDFFWSLSRISYVYALKENYSEAMKWSDRYIEVVKSLGNKADAYRWRGFVYFWLGRIDESLNDLREASRLYKIVGNEYLKSYTDWLKGWIYFEEEEYDTSRELFKIFYNSRIKNYPQNLPDYKAMHFFVDGLIFLKQGKLDSAKFKLAQVKSILPKISPTDIDEIEFYYDILYRKILLTEGELDKAIIIFQKESDLKIPSMFQISLTNYNLPFIRDGLAQAYYKTGELDKAITEYKRLITFDPNNKDRRLLHPKYHYRLAKLYEEKAWPGKAIEQYEKFLEIWKDADEDLPEKIEAKLRLAKLKERN